MELWYKHSVVILLQEVLYGDGVFQTPIYEYVLNVYLSIINSLSDLFPSVRAFMLERIDECAYVFLWASSCCTIIYCTIFLKKREVMANLVVVIFQSSYGAAPSLVFIRELGINIYLAIKQNFTISWWSFLNSLHWSNKMLIKC